VPAKSYYEESQLEIEEAQMHFAALKLLLNKNDRVALRYLLGIGSPNFRAAAYAKLRAHCEKTGDTPWAALEKVSDGKLKLSRVKPLVEHFDRIKVILADLEPFRDDVPHLIDELFPASIPAVFGVT
jgi:DNA helicase-2/ATP-dependent DNA helicase PcrA